MVARDEDTVADEREVPVRVSRHREHFPPVDDVARVKQLRVAHVADERRVDEPASSSSFASAGGTPFARNQSAITWSQSSFPQTCAHCS